MLMTFANSLDPDQARHNVGPVIGLNCLTLTIFLKELKKNVLLKKYQQYHAHYQACHRVKPIEPWHEISNNVVYAFSKGSDQPAHTNSLIRAFASHLNIL